ncbi:hypothetical protein HZZ00_15410 [Streptomyces sp. NEAU-sy36]|nr:MULTISPECIES: hypothetical protein [unclassified Streptomyces]QLJ02276.1 hypothetical protein HZZ00_15410 [Streptomyces sp. NEAU-sy36]
MPETERSAGTIDCVDTGGDGPVLVSAHGNLSSFSRPALVAWVPRTA